MTASPNPNPPRIEHLRYPGPALVARHPLGEMVRFGRSGGCELVLDPEDRSISRVAGTVHRHGGAWLLRNASSRATLHLHRTDGAIEQLRPGDRPRELWSGDEVEIPTAAFPHRLRFVLPSPGPRTDPGLHPSTPTENLPGLVTRDDLRLDRNQWQLLAALMIGWVLPHRYAREPTDDDTIIRLITPTGGELMSRKAVQLRIKRLRERVAEQTGEPLATRWDLCHWAESALVITARDVEQLPGLRR
jgi:hypothetical protein